MSNITLLNRNYSLLIIILEQITIFHVIFFEVLNEMFEYRRSFVIYMFVCLLVNLFGY